MVDRIVRHSLGPPITIVAARVPNISAERISATDVV